MNQMMRPGMYARKIGITQAMTGPIASSSSPLHIRDTQTLNPTHARVRVNAIAKRTLGRRPDAGALRQIRPPRGRSDERRDPRSPSATAISLSTEGSGDDIAPPRSGRRIRGDRSPDFTAGMEQNDLAAMRI